MTQDDNRHDWSGPDRGSRTYNVSHTDNANPQNVKSGVDTSTEHTKSMHLVHPVEDVAELYGTEMSQYLLRRAQVDNSVGPGTRQPAVERRVDRAFDRRVIELTKVVLHHPVPDATPGEFPIKDSAVLMLVLQRVRGSTAEAFSAHLEEVPTVGKELGVDGNLDEETIAAWEAELSDTDEEALEACATRVLYAVYRDGQAFPQQVWDAVVATPDSWLLTKENKEKFDDGRIPANVTRIAVQNWADEFLETVMLGEFSLGRDESRTQYPAMSIIGVLAHAAVQRRTITSACKTCAGWFASPELVPSRKTVMDHIADLSIDEISRLFQHLNQLFLEFANEYTILHGSKQLAFDETSILYNIGDEDDRWRKGYAERLKGVVDASDADHQLELGLAAIIEEDVRFALGMYPVKKEYSDDERNRESIRSADVISRLLRPTQLETPVSVGVTVMDSGLSGADLIRRARDTLGDHWIIRAPHEHEIKELVADTPQDKPVFKKIEDYFADLSQKPNAFIVPAPHGHSSKHSQWVFLTDMPREAFLKETENGTKELDKETVISTYQHRCRIEKTLEEIKEHFDIRVRENTDTNIQYFCLNMSMLFYNLHNLISNSTAPKSGLPLGKTRGKSHGEVLSAIREGAFKIAAEQKASR